jgi:tRNA U38,U39,U40 pseudouridine synthase TruA
VRTHLEQWEMREGHSSARTDAGVHGSRGIYNVGSRYQATTDEDTAHLEDLVHALVKYKEHELARAL